MSSHADRETKPSRLLGRAPFLFNLLPYSKYNLSNLLSNQTFLFTREPHYFRSPCLWQRLIQTTARIQLNIRASAFSRNRINKSDDLFSRKQASVSNVNEVTDSIINNYKASSSLFAFVNVSSAPVSLFLTDYSNCFPRILFHSVSERN